MAERTTWSCRDCRFYGNDKRCRFNPPTVVVTVIPDGYDGTHSQIEQHLPYMEDTDLCGRWQSSRIISYPKMENQNAR